MEECSKFGQPIIFSTSASAQKEWRNAQDSGNPSWSPRRRRHKKSGGMLKVRATHHFLHVGTKRMEECSKFEQPIIFSTSALAQKEWRNAQSPCNPSFSPRRRGTKRMEECSKFGQPIIFSTSAQKEWRNAQNSGNPSFSPRRHKKNGGILQNRATHHFLHVGVGTKRMEECSKFGQPIIFSTSAHKEWRNAQNSGNPSFSQRRHKNSGGMLKIRATHHFLHVGVGTKRMEECSRFGQLIIFSTSAQKEWRNAQHSGNPSFSPRRHKKNGGMLKIRATHHFLHVGTKRMEECSKFEQPIIFSTSAQKEWRNAQNSGNPSFSPRRHKKNGGMLKIRATHHFLHVGVGTKRMEECSQFGQPIIFSTSAQEEWRNAPNSGNPSFSPRRHKKNGGMLKVRATHHFLHVGTKRMEECSKFGQPIIFSTSAQEEWRNAQNSGNPSFSPRGHKKNGGMLKVRATHHFPHVGTKRMEKCSKFGQPIIFSTSAQEEWRNGQNSGNPSFSPRRHKKNGGMLKIRATHDFLHVGTKNGGMLKIQATIAGTKR